MIKRAILFLILNFAALAIGGLFTGDGVPSEWYQELNKAPWTPPGWAFGAAWTLIMICFSFYMALLTKGIKREIVILFALQWILNISWNPIFFYFNAVFFGLVNITLLLLLVGYFAFAISRNLKLESLLIAPYLIWLTIATSLNAYILMFN